VIRKALLLAVLALTLPAASLDAAPAASKDQRSYMVAGYQRVGYIDRTYGGRWNIYVDYENVGYLRQSVGGRWNIYIDYQLVGYIRPSTSGRLSVWVDYLPVGYVRRLSGTRWNAYHDYLPIGYGQGLGAPLAAGALVALMEIAGAV